MGTARSAIAFSIASELHPALSIPVGQFGFESGQLLRHPPQKPEVFSSVFGLVFWSIAFSFSTKLICPCRPRVTAPSADRSIASPLINILYDLRKICLSDLIGFLGISAEQIRRIPGNVLYDLNRFLLIFTGYGMPFLIPPCQNSFVLYGFPRRNNAVEFMYSCVYLGVPWFFVSSPIVFPLEIKCFSICFIL